MNNIYQYLYNVLSNKKSNDTSVEKQTLLIHIKLSNQRAITV